MMPTLAFNELRKLDNVENLKIILLKATKNGQVRVRKITTSEPIITECSEVFGRSWSDCLDFFLAVFLRIFTREGLI